MLNGLQQERENLGLAYDLDAKGFPNLLLYDWSFILSQGDESLFTLDNKGTRKTGITIPNRFAADYDEFDVIIRNTTYAQDFYVICGSYRAFFSELNGGAGAWAWDGFITFIRGHNINMKSLADIPVPTPENVANDPTKFWVTPGIIDGQFIEQPFTSETNSCYTYLCRMPYEVEPDLTGISSDSTPGVYSIDQVKNISLGFELIMVAAGHQRIASTEGMTSSQSYSGWISQLNFEANPQFSIGNNEPVPGGREAITKYRGLGFLEANSFTASWKGDQANHIGRYLTDNGQIPSIKYAIEDVARTINTLSTAGGSGTFNFDLLTATDNGYYLSRIHDVVVVNGGPFPLRFGDLTDNASQTICITGEAIANDGAGAISFTTPFVSYWQPNNPPPPAGTGDNQLYTALGNKNWGIDSSLPAYDLNGSYGTVLIPTFSSSPDPFLVNMAIGVDNVTHGATTSAEIYVANFQYVLGCFTLAPDLTPPRPTKSEVVFPFAIKGGGFETATGFTLPEKWMGKAVQQATYTSSDEATAKGLAEYEAFLADPNRATETTTEYLAYEDRSLLALLQTDPTLKTETPNPLNYLVSARPPNYYEYGAGLSGQEPVGFPSNIAYGFLGFSAGTGPVIFMYDFGTLTMYPTNTNPTTFGIGVSASVDALLNQTFDTISVGSSLNDSIVIDKGSTTRQPVSARWDADRDQWIFTFADTGGGSLVSCNSAFDRQPPTQIAYLDQTDQFESIDSDAKSSLYISRNMTPFLDGLVLFGGALETNNKGQSAITSIEISVTDPLNPGVPYTVRGFQPYIIQGTTGREARVWVDYLLFDGVDSMVATELQSLGLRVTVENVEWYKAKILKSGKLGITPEEIEDWVRNQQEEYRETLKLKERQGRLRTRRRQQAAWRVGLEDTISGDFLETTGFDSAEAIDKASETFVPHPSDSAPISGNKSKKHSSIQKSKSDKKRDSDA